MHFFFVALIISGIPPTDANNATIIVPYYSSCPTATDLWCTSSCNANPPFCPSQCCEILTQIAQTYSVASGLACSVFTSAWCAASCAVGDTSSTYFVDILCLSFSWPNLTKTMWIRNSCRGVSELLCQRQYVNPHTTPHYTRHCIDAFVTNIWDAY